MVPELIAFGFGAFAGSFLNVCAHRLPRNESVVLPPSRCYSCGTRVRWYDNLPVVSYVALRGRCRWCGAGFSPRYVIMEIAVGLLTAGATAAVLGLPGWVAPWAGPTLGPELALTLAVAAVVVLVFTLVVATATDLDHLIIPDEVTMPLAVVAVPLAACCGTNLLLGWTPAAWFAHLDVFGKLVPTQGDAALWFAAIVLGGAGALAASLPLARRLYDRFSQEDQRWSPADHRAFAWGVGWHAGILAAWAGLLIALLLTVSPGPWLGWAVGFGQALLGSLAGFALPYFIGLVFTAIFQRNALGFGDVKLLGPVGAFLGPVGVLYCFFGAAVLGTAIAVPHRLLGGKREIPFGPYLAGGAVLALTVGPFLHQRWFGGW